MKNAENTIVYKPADDSYKGLSIEERAGLSGTRQLMALTKKGLKNNDGEAVKLFHLAAFKASLLGYNYVLLSKRRTNSGRLEAVRIGGSYSIHLGQKLAQEGYRPQSRSLGTPRGTLCTGDVSIPQDTMPRNYDDLPIHPSMIHHFDDFPANSSTVQATIKEQLQLPDIDPLPAPSVSVPGIKQLKLEFLRDMAKLMLFAADELENEIRHDQNEHR